MAWSTRQLADLAGISIRTVRHYHDVGLLEVPERQANGYKQYSVSHLVRLLRIRGLVGLGFSLSQVADLQQPDHDSTDTLHHVAAQLDESIAQLQRAKDQVHELLLSAGAEPELDHALSRLADITLSSADRDLLVVLTRMVRADVIDSLVHIVRRGLDDPVLVALDTLPADADQGARDDLAERLSHYLTDIHREHPGLVDVTRDGILGRRETTRTIKAAIDDLYNVAQVDVVVRAATLTLPAG